MAVIKLSGSKKAVQFVLSESASPGDIFQCSSSVFELLLKGQARGGFVVLTKLATPTSGSRFPQSEVWGDDLRVDSFSDKGKKAREERDSVVKSEGYTPEW